MKTAFTILDAIKYAISGTYMLYLEDEKKKVKAKLFMENFSIRQHYSFMDLYIKKSINIVPVMAVDFSLANLTFDAGQYCTHTLKDGAPNDYIDCMKSVHKSFNHFYRFMISYGFGARTMKYGKKEIETSNLFSLTGEYNDPFITNQSALVNGYINTLKDVELALPVFYQKVIKQVCDLAELEMKKFESEEADIHEVKNYYVLIL
jgi:hypothetical protein